MKSIRHLTFLAAFASAAFGAERATFDSAGELTSVISNGAELPIHGGLFATFTGGLIEPLQPHDQRSPISREGLELSWKGSATFPTTAKAEFTAHWKEIDTGLELKTSARPEGRFPMDLVSLDYVIDLPRESFQGGSFGDSHKSFPETRPTNPTFYRETVDQLTLADSKAWTLTLNLDQARKVSIEDHWDAKGRRVYRVKIELHSGAWMTNQAVDLSLKIKADAHPSAAPAQVSVDATKPLYPFDGFGGNYCFNTETPVVEYTMENLNLAWARLELKAAAWDREHDKPGAALKRDFELMQRIQKMNIPWIISVWRLPERFYSDSNQKPFGTFGRRISMERWPEFLDLISSYLVYLKKNYGAEPDFFSFNEPDLGVDIGFTGETHREAIKLIGAHFASLGLKTKLLLGDTANPRDTHVFTLPTAADPEAMKYVGAVSFHSWGNGSPEQYRSWGEVGQWLNLPLVVAEAGVDPGSYRNSMFDSYAYGLREMQQYQELFRDSRPTTLIYWQYTEDYGFVRVKADKTLEPTGRFYLLKQLTSLTPKKSHVVQSHSDQPDLLVSAFEKDGTIAVHILNRGSERDVSLSGLPNGKWRTVTTTETEGLHDAAEGFSNGKVHVPARSLTTIALTK